MIDYKQLENAEFFKHLGRMITNDARCTREIQPRIAMEKTTISWKKTFLQRTELKYEEVASKVLHLEHRIVEC
jgi:hypothetical protein